MLLYTCPTSKIEEERKATWDSGRPLGQLSAFTSLINVDLLNIVDTSISTCSLGTGHIFHYDRLLHKSHKNFMPHQDIVIDLLTQQRPLP